MTQYDFVNPADTLLVNVAPSEDRFTGIESPGQLSDSSDSFSDGSIALTGTFTESPNDAVSGGPIADSSKDTIADSPKQASEDTGQQDAGDHVCTTCRLRPRSQQPKTSTRGNSKAGHPLVGSSNRSPRLRRCSPVEVPDEFLSILHFASPSSARLASQTGDSAIEAWTKISQRQRTNSLPDISHQLSELEENPEENPEENKQLVYNLL